MQDYTENRQTEAQQTGVRTGLGEAEAARRLARDGENILREAEHAGLWLKFMRQFKDVMVLILIAAAVISFVVALLEPHGEFLDSIVILAIVVLNAVLGTVQETRAERALDALKDLSAPTARVLRDGVVQEIPAAGLVEGDVVLLEAGDFVPADLRLMESASLKCEESALTGESVPADKDAGAQVPADAPLGDRINMAFAGCSVTYGRAVGEVVATGMRTQLGKIADLLSREQAEPTPLQQKLAKLGKYLGILAIVICVVIFAIGLIQGMELLTIFMTAVSLAVAAIPEGMTMVVTVVLALGVQRMARRGAIIRSLPAVETLGSASVICSDKTGTLTQNRMTVQLVWPVGGRTPEEMGDSLGPQALQVVRLGALCNDGRIEEDADGGQQQIGDPTETAILAAALENGLKKAELDRDFKRLAELPFDSDRKLMTTVHEVSGRKLAIVKGGYDVLLPLCVGAERDRADEVNREMGDSALRVLAVACRELAEIPDEMTHENIERDLMFIGLIGMMDPPREESRVAVETCTKAGIRTVMITGDHAATARAIARELGIAQEGDETLTGAELARLSQQQLEEQVERYSVYARVSPEDKIRIVKAWQARGDVVAMTGDGVNDAPALSAADIGCAMGQTGTDVARSAADMVLTDDNFSTIVEAVREGRGIYENIRKTIQFLLGSNLGEVLTVFFAMILGWGSPLLAIHLLLVNVVTDALPALALGVEPIDANIMTRNPVPRGQGIFANRLGFVIVLQGVMVSALTLIGYYVGSFVELSPYFAPGHEIGMTMAFLVLALSQLVQAFNCRSARSLFAVGFLSNKTMLKAFGISALIVLLICLVPPLEAVFRVVDLSMLHWLLVAALAIAPLVITEIVKAFVALRQKVV